MENSNPYATPEATDELRAGDAANLGEMVRGWEKLRLLYNAILLLPGLGVITLWIVRAKMPVPEGIVLSMIVGIGANLLFFLGPLAELYFRGIFLRGSSMGKGRMLIFGAGLLVSFGLFALVALVAMLAFRN